MSKTDNCARQVVRPKKDKKHKFEIQAEVHEDGTSTIRLEGEWVTPVIWGIISNHMTKMAVESTHVKTRNLADVGMTGELYHSRGNWIVLEVRKRVFLQGFLDDINAILIENLNYGGYNIVVETTDLQSCIDIMLEVGCYGRTQRKSDDESDKYIFTFGTVTNIEHYRVLDLIKEKQGVIPDVADVPEDQEPEEQEP